MNNRIKELRKQLNITQTGFGLKIGRGQPAVQQYETGKRQIDETTLLLICKTFNVNEEWLRNGTGLIFSDDTQEIGKSTSEPQKRAINEIYGLTDDETNRVLDFIKGMVANRPNNADKSLL